MAQAQKAFLTLLTMVFSVILGVLAIKTHWADTELWSITVANKLFSGEIDHSLTYKILFNVLLKTLYIFDLSNIQTIYVARGIFWLLGLGILYQVYVIGDLFHGQKKKALFACFIILTSSFYLSRGFRVRSDVLACFFQLLYMVSFLKFNKLKGNKWCFIGLFALAAMMASTPKAILFFIAQFSFIAVYTISSRKFDQTFKFITITIMPLLITGIFVIMMMKDQFFAAHTYFVNSFGQGFAKPSYFSMKGFYFAFRYLKENPIITLSVVLCLFSSLRIKKSLQKTPEGKAIAFTFFVSLAFVVLHNDRLPFYINLMMIIPVMVSSWVISDVLDSLSRVKRMKSIYQVALILFLIKGIYYSQRNLMRNSNHDQIQTVHYLEDYLSQYPGSTYYDGMGALPRNNTVYHFITPSLGENLKNTLEIIQRKDPDLIFFSNRMFYFMKPIIDQLKVSSYIYLGGGVYGKHEPIEKLAHTKSYKYQGSFFLKLKPVEGDFDPEQKMKVYSRFAPVSLPTGAPFFQVFDFDPRF